MNIIESVALLTQSKCEKNILDFICTNISAKCDVHSL